MGDAKPVAVMLVGLPGSGKSTWTNSITTGPLRDAVLISTDNHIESSATSVGKTYGEVFKDQIGPATEQMKAQLNAAIAEKKNIVWDQTNLTVKSRKPKIQQLTQAGYEVIAVTFELDAEELMFRQQKRRADTGKFIPMHIVDSMKASYEKPTTAEGFTRVTEA